MSVTFNSTTPSPAAGKLNVGFQKDGSGNVSAEYTAPFDVPIFAPGVGANAQILLRVKLTRAVLFPASAANSYAAASTNATADTTFTLKKNGSSFATVKYSAGGAVGAFTQASDESFAAGDLLEVDGPATADATLADVGITLYGYRTS
jgi:hypothetical protein